MGRIIVIISGKGGVGKTTTAVNLGAAMNQFGKDTLVIDANISTPNVGIHLNSPEVPINLNQILEGKATVLDAVYEHDSGLKVMPSSLSIKELKKIKPERMSKYKKDFQRISEIVFVDSSASIGVESLSAMRIADEILIVTNPEMPSLIDSLKTIKVAHQMRKPIIGVVMTRVKNNSTEMQSDVVKDMLEIPVIGMIPEDKLLQKALNLGDAVVHTHPKSKPSRAYKEIASKIGGLEYDSKKDRFSLTDLIVGRSRDSKT